MTIGRIATLVFVVIVCLIAPQLGNPKFKGIFNYIQEFQGYISPGILAAFVFGLIFKRAPAAAGISSMILSVPIYGFLQWQFSHVAFLNTHLFPEPGIDIPNEGLKFGVGHNTFRHIAAGADFLGIAFGHSAPLG